MVIKFKNEEIDYLKKSLIEHQQAAGVLDFVSALIKNYESLEYPITTFRDLIEKLSKCESRIKNLSKDELFIGEEVLKIDSLRALIPAYYFPISNKEDLEDKVTELYGKKTIPVKQIPPFPNEFKDIDKKPKESQA